MALATDDILTIQKLIADYNHAVDAGDPARMRTGMRVRPRWRAERVGSIRDIECFEPEA